MKIKKFLEDVLDISQVITMFMSTPFTAPLGILILGSFGGALEMFLIFVTWTIMTLGFIKTIQDCLKDDSMAMSFSFVCGIFFFLPYILYSMDIYSFLTTGMYL